MPPVRIVREIGSVPSACNSSSSGNSQGELSSKRPTVPHSRPGGRGEEEWPDAPDLRQQTFHRFRIFGSDDQPMIA